MRKLVEGEPTDLGAAIRPLAGPVSLIGADTNTDISPSTGTCRIDRLERFKSDMGIYSELLLDEGKDIDSIEISTERLSDVFRNASPRRQRELSGELIDSISAKLRGRFFPDLNLLHDLLREDGQDAMKVAEDQRTWRELFEQSPRKDRLQVVRDVREKTENMLRQSFDGYLQSWNQILSDSHTTSPEEASQEVNKLKQTFDGASKRGKVGLSKQLREKIEANSTGKFSAFLDLYTDLLKRNGHHLTPGELPTAEEWIERYNNAPIGEKGHVIDQLHNRITILNTFRRQEA